MLYIVLISRQTIPVETGQGSQFSDKAVGWMSEESCFYSRQVHLLIPSAESPYRAWGPSSHILTICL
jgi:hypothetical protein